MDNLVKNFSRLVVFLFIFTINPINATELSKTNPIPDTCSCKINGDPNKPGICACSDPKSDTCTEACHPMHPTRNS